MTTPQPIEILLTHIKLQAAIYNVEATVAFDYTLLNLYRNTGEISKQEYHETLLEITAEIAQTEEVWDKYITFAEFVTTLTNEYFLEYWFELEDFLSLFPLSE
ncbi:hypothetical protein [Crocosphaera watsonii]|uniref:Uncharacterized protein n=1 Tax=Crocosphaera watsonii WH 0401 TaxID=555881 RepID=T2J797_CROWT|nr:hypothetical protein [Crocosphaera watsonii]CCQ60362.1 hypothetical protein CWATWH0401_2753 [Crocosphaera watsonii WH 0401]